MGQFNANDTIDRLTAVYEMMDDDTKRESEPLLYLFGHMIEFSTAFDDFMNGINGEIDNGCPNVKKLNSLFKRMIAVMDEAAREG